MTQEATETTLPSPTEAVETQATEKAEETQKTEAVEEAPAEPVVPGYTGDPYDVLELDDFKPILERRSGLIEQGLREDFESRLAAATKNWESTNTHSNLAGITGNLQEKLEASDIEGAERIVARLEKFREPYMEAHTNELQSKGASAMGNQILRDMMGALDIRSQEVLFDLAKKANNWEPVVKKFLELGGKKDYERGLKENRDAAAEREKLEARQGQGANLAPGSTAGGTKKYKDLTPDERKAMSSSEIDAMLARERER